MAETCPRSCSAPPSPRYKRPPRTPQVEAPRRRCSRSAARSASRENQPERWAASEAPQEPFGLGTQQRIVGIQHQQAGRHDGGGDGEFHFGQCRKIVDAVFAEMIGAHVGHHRRVGMRHRDPAAQNAAACRFQNGRLGAPLAHHHACAGGPGVIARRQRFIVEKDPIRAVVSRAPAVGPRAGGEKAHGGGFAVGPGDDGRRDVAQLLPAERPRRPAMQ